MAHKQKQKNTAKAAKTGTHITAAQAKVVAERELRQAAALKENLRRRKGGGKTP